MGLVARILGSGAVRPAVLEPVTKRASPAREFPCDFRDGLIRLLSDVPPGQSVSKPKEFPKGIKVNPYFLVGRHSLLEPPGRLLAS
jgi:hypothetical protein